MPEEVLVVDAVANRQRFFLDGRLVSSKDLSRLAPNAVSLMLGVNPNETRRDLYRKWPYALHPYFKGVIDDVAIWDRPLSDFEIDLITESSLELGALLGRSDEDSDGIDDAWEMRYG